MRGIRFLSPRRIPRIERGYLRLSPLADGHNSLKITTAIMPRFITCCASLSPTAPKMMKYRWGVMSVRAQSDVVSPQTSSTASTNDSRNEEVAQILSDWPSKYRLGINYTIRHLADDRAYTEAAKGRYIDANMWAGYLATFRRKVSKEPLSFFTEHADFLELCGKMDAITTDILANGPLSATSLASIASSASSRPNTAAADIATGNSILNQSSHPTPSKHNGGGRFRTDRTLENLQALQLIESSRNENEKAMVNDSPLLEETKKYLFNAIISRAEVELEDVIAAYQTLCLTSDLRLPHLWYPLARVMKRRVIYHGGPTNSGKTYQALKRLAEADPEKGGGLYCGPLRLLALEVYESLNRQGVYTDLLTGQEKSIVPFSTHVSCTLEMVNLQKEYDVAVIDEIQMIANDQRGYAWTRALQGLRAREIHLCGGLEASNIVQKLIESTGDEFILHKYERLSSLEIEDSSLKGDYSKIQPGDCVVAFSKQDIFSIRRQIERLTPYKCAVIYGQLPPETRSNQARLFNDENTGYDVLVASDAIGLVIYINKY